MHFRCCAWASSRFAHLRRMLIVLSTALQVPGLVVYNDTSQSWSNVSSKGYSSSGYSLGGAAQFISGYGTDGLLFVLGGLTTSTTWVYGHGTDWGNFVSFGYAYMYDPVTKEWQSQETTGDIPAGVASPCIVGVQGENSYEVRKARRQQDEAKHCLLDIPLWRLHRGC